ncbi:hypothetical protein D9M69_570570 [compost metagenome]
MLEVFRYEVKALVDDVRPAAVPARFQGYRGPEVGKRRKMQIPMLADARVEDRPEKGVATDTAVEVVNDRPDQVFGYAGRKQRCTHDVSINVF